MSFNVRVNLTGMQRVMREQPGRVERWLNEYAEEIVADVKKSFGTSPPGRRYRRGRGGRIHVASLPGYPPNVDYGTLRASIRQRRAGRLKRQVETGVEYARDVEFGRGRVRARPFMRPVFDKVRKNMEKEAAKGLNLE